jgi:transposase
MTDIDQSRVLEVTPDRASAAADQLWKTLSDEQRSEVNAVCRDMWQACEASTEHRELQQGGDDRLKGVRQILLFNPENLSEEKNEELAALRRSTLATGRAWSLKELFRFFWHETDAVGGRAFFESWYAWAIRSRLDPIRKVARMLKTRLDRILTWFASPISNGVAEGFNSRTQSIKPAARGFRLFEHYRIRILFYCEKLSLKPLEN